MLATGSAVSFSAVLNSCGLIHIKFILDLIHNDIERSVQRRLEQETKVVSIYVG